MFTLYGQCVVIRSFFHAALIPDWGYVSVYLGFVLPPSFPPFPPLSIVLLLLLVLLSPHFSLLYFSSLYIRVFFPRQWEPHHTPFLRQSEINSPHRQRQIVRSFIRSPFFSPNSESARFFTERGFSIPGNLPVNLLNVFEGKNSRPPITPPSLPPLAGRFSFLRHRGLCRRAPDTPPSALAGRTPRTRAW